MRAGRFDQVIELCEERLAAAPLDTQAGAMLGIACVSKGLFAEAADAFAKLVSLSPDQVPPRIWLARCKTTLGDSESAISILRQAALLAKNDAEALLEIGDGFTSARAHEDALEAYTAAETLRPGNAQIAFKKGEALQHMKRPQEALIEFQRVVQIRPDIPDAYARIGAIEVESGHYERARGRFELAAKYAGPRGVGFQFARAGLTPVIFESNDEIDQVRARVKSEFEALRLQRLRLRDPFIEVGATNSYNTYHGRPNRSLQEVISRTYLAACADLAWTAPNLGTNGDRIQLGICSAFMWEHTIGRVMLGLFQQLNRTRFEVTLFRTGRAVDPLGRALDAAVDRVVSLPGSLAAARQVIAGHRPDVLMYTDFGAEPLTSFLSYSRLAPVQVVAWGFPDTSGVPNLDYYASTAVFEPEDAQAQYSETLIALPRLYSFMFAPEITTESCTKRELGFEDSDRIYVCAQSLFKVHPDFDETVAGILRSDEKARVVFFEGPEPHWSELLRARFARTLGDVAGRAVFLPRLSAPKFQSMLRLADALIDTNHFTGGYTTYLSFANHKPVVTWNGNLMRGRMTQGMYKLMGMEPLSADTTEQFVGMAVRLATDAAFKKDLESQLAERSPRLFEDVAAVRDFERFLVSANLAAREGRKLSGWDDVSPN